MSRPQTELLFELMGIGFRRDTYAKAGDMLDEHHHPFDHGVYVEIGALQVNWYNPDHEEILRPGQGAAMFRAGRKHSTTALENGTVAMSVVPAGILS